MLIKYFPVPCRHYYMQNTWQEHMQFTTEYLFCVFKFIWAEISFPSWYWPREAELSILLVISVMWKMIKISMHCTKSISRFLVDWHHRKAVQLNSQKIYFTLLQAVMVWSRQSNNNALWQQIRQYIPWNLSKFGKINFSLFLAFPVHHLGESYMKFRISMAKFLLLS